MKEDIEALTGLLRRYVSPGAGSMRAIFQKAAISRTGPEPNAAVRVVATGVVDPSDSLTLTWSVVDHRPEKIEVGSELDGKPVGITVDYTALPGGR